MTTTAITAGQAIGTLTNIGADLFATRTAVQTTSDRFFVEAKVTNGAGNYDQSKRIIVWFAPYSVSVTAALAPELLRNIARFVEVIPSKFGSVARVRTSLCEPLSGGYIYVWCEIPTVTVAQSLDISLIEGP